MKYAIGFIVMALGGIAKGIEGFGNRIEAVCDYLAGWRKYPGPHDKGD